ncbi:MAG: histidine phosphatase family protein, partial [Chitinivibrionia bacterium]|nr:histidine phosphatase family protein [Chitinivibrionia bacterium]
VRHGIAVNLGEAGVTNDDDRFLTQEGREKVARIASGLRQVDVKPDVVVSSPLCRAVETAELLMAGLSVRKAVETCDILSCGARTSDLLTWLRTRTESSIMIVGHMPDVAQFCADLLTPHSDLGMVFKKGAVCHISFSGKPDMGKGMLELLLQPHQALRISNS